MDEPALREGLPLKRARWESYLSWAVRAFRLSTVVAEPSTQIVTHLCYSEFADILPVSTPAPPCSTLQPASPGPASGLQHACPPRMAHLTLWSNRRGDKTPTGFCTSGER